MRKFIPVVFVFVSFFLVDGVFAAVPPVPTDFTVSAPSACSNQLDFNQPQGAGADEFQFRVKVHGFQTGWNPLGKLSGEGAHTEIVSELNPGTEYEYEIKSCSTGVVACSGAVGSAPDTITTPSVSSPMTLPLDFRVTDEWRDNGLVVLTWDVPADIEAAYSGDHGLDDPGNEEIWKRAIYGGYKITGDGVPLQVITIKEFLDEGKRWSYLADSALPHTYEVKTYRTDAECQPVRSSTDESASWVKFSTDSVSVFVPATPELLNPVTSLAGGELRVNFKWSGVEGARSYDFQLFDSAGGILQDRSGLTEPELANIPLGNGETFQYRVRACVEGSCSNFSQKTFTAGFVAPADPRATVVGLSEDGAGGLVADVRLEWVDLAIFERTIEIRRRESTTGLFTLVETIVGKEVGRVGGAPIYAYDNFFIHKDVPVGVGYEYEVGFDAVGVDEEVFYVRAGVNLDISPIKGWAWADVGGVDNIRQGVGWIRLSWNTGEGKDGSGAVDDSGVKYSVYVENDTGFLGGYGWSGTDCPPGDTRPVCGFGWLSFSKSDLRGCPSAPDDNLDHESCVAKLDLATGQLSGWARFLSGSKSEGAFTGWVSLRGVADDGARYGVCFGDTDPVGGVPPPVGGTGENCAGNGDFSSGSVLGGWGWGSDVTGWVQFIGGGVGSAGVLLPPNVTLTALPGMDEGKLGMRVEWVNGEDYDSLEISLKKVSDITWQPLFEVFGDDLLEGAVVRMPDRFVFDGETVYQFQFRYSRGALSDERIFEKETYRATGDGTSSPSREQCQSIRGVSIVPELVELRPGEVTEFRAVINYNVPGCEEEFGRFFELKDWRLVEKVAGGGTIGQVFGGSGTDPARMALYSAPVSVPEEVELPFEEVVMASLYFDADADGDAEFLVPGLDDGSASVRIQKAPKSSLVDLLGARCDQSDPGDVKVEVRWMDSIEESHQVYLVRADGLAVTEFPVSVVPVDGVYTYMDSFGIEEGEFYRYRLRVEGSEEVSFPATDESVLAFCSADAPYNLSVVHIGGVGFPTFNISWATDRLEKREVGGAEVFRDHYFSVERLKVTPERIDDLAIDLREQDLPPRTSPFGINYSWTGKTPSGLPLSYEVEVSGDTGGRSFLNGDSTVRRMETVSSSGTDSGLDEASVYYYRARACSLIVPVPYTKLEDQTVVPDENENICSRFSDVMGVTTPPNAPGGVSVESLSSSRVGVTWADNSVGEDGYVVERKKVGGSWVEALNNLSPSCDFGNTLNRGTSGSVTCVDTGLESDTNYFYRVRTYKDDMTVPGGGDRVYSAWSDEDSGKTHFVITVTYIDTGGSVKMYVGDDLKRTCSSVPCSKEFSNGTTVRVFGDDFSCYDFDRWEGSCSGTDPSCVKSGDAKDVKAYFDDDTNKISASAGPAGGGVIQNPTSYEGCGCDDKSFTAVPDAGFKVSSWNVANCDAGELVCGDDDDENVTTCSADVRVDFEADAGGPGAFIQSMDFFASAIDSLGDGLLRVSEEMSEYVKGAARVAADASFGSGPVRSPLSAQGAESGSRLERLTSNGVNVQPSVVGVFSPLLEKGGELFYSIFSVDVSKAEIDLDGLFDVAGEEVICQDFKKREKGEVNRSLEWRGGPACGDEGNRDDSGWTRLDLGAVYMYRVRAHYDDEPQRFTGWSPKRAQLGGGELNMNLDPRVWVWADRESISDGESAVVYWKSENALEATLGGGDVGVSGSKVVSPGVSTGYTVEVVGFGGQKVNASVCIDVDGAGCPVLPNPPPTVQVSASPSVIGRGQSATLSWQTTDADSVKVTFDSGFNVGVVIDPPDLSGSENVQPVVTTTYKVEAFGPGGETSDFVTVSVVDSAGGENPPPVPRGDGGGDGGIISVPVRACVEYGVCETLQGVGIGGEVPVNGCEDNNDCKRFGRSQRGLIEK